MGVPTTNSKRLTATANRLILAADERSLQVDLVRLDRNIPTAGCVASRDPLRHQLNVLRRKSPRRLAWQNGYAERLIGSIRRECTNHLIVFNAEHLRLILARYAAY